MVHVVHSQTRQEKQLVLQQQQQQQQQQEPQKQNAGGPGSGSGSGTVAGFVAGAGAGAGAGAASSSTSEPAAGARSSNNNSSSSSSSLSFSLPFATATWPDALPPHPETMILSICCGNSHYSWALHDRGPPDFMPTLFWRTRPVDPDMYSGMEPCEALEAVMPIFALARLFGSSENSISGSSSNCTIMPPPAPRPPVQAAEDEDDGVIIMNNDDNNNNNNIPENNPTARIIEPEDGSAFQNTCFTRLQILQNAVSQRTPFAQVYLMSTNPAHERGVAFLLQDLPVQVIKLQSHDFFSMERGGYEGLGVDRAAAAKAAMAITGTPALVVDGGTALTYTAVDVQGKLQGGGISPGLQLKFRALGAGTGQLPTLSAPFLDGIIHNCKSNQAPLRLFDSRTTSEAMVSSVFAETAAHVCTIVALWREQALAQLAQKNSTNEEPPQQEAAPTLTATAATETSTAMATTTNAAANNTPNTNSTDATSTSKPSSSEGKDKTTNDNSNNSGVEDACTSKLNTNATVVLTGGDGLLLKDFLSPQHSHILPRLIRPPSSTSSSSSSSGVVAPVAGVLEDYPEVHLIKNLVHFGISQLLQEQYLHRQKQQEIQLAKCSRSEVKELKHVAMIRETMIGLRVIRAERDNGQVQEQQQQQQQRLRFVRGTVVGIVVSKDKAAKIDDDIYQILYDDKVRAKINLGQLYDGLIRFKEHGEEFATSLDASSSNARMTAKRIDAARAVALLLETCPNLKPTSTPDSSSLSNKETNSNKHLLDDSARATESGARNKKTKTSGSTFGSASPLTPQQQQKALSSALRKMVAGSSSSKISSLSVQQNPRSVMNRRVVKQFLDRKWYYGTIVGFYPKDDTQEEVDLWNILYDDDDREDLDLDETVAGLKNYERRKHLDPNPKEEAAPTAPAAAPLSDAGADTVWNAN